MVCSVKCRHYVNFETLRMIYFGIFSSILIYGSQIWGQHNAVVKKLQVLQNKALRIMTFSHSRSSAIPLYKKCNILKLSDNISLQNFLFAHDSLLGNLPSPLCGKLSFVNTVNNTRNQTYFQLDRTRTKTILYGSNSIKSKSIDVWNFINKLFYQEKLHQPTRKYCKNFVTKFLMER